MYFIVVHDDGCEYKKRNHPCLNSEFGCKNCLRTEKYYFVDSIENNLMISNISF